MRTSVNDRSSVFSAMSSMFDCSLHRADIIAPTTWPGPVFVSMAQEVASSTRTVECQ